MRNLKVAFGIISLFWWWGSFEGLSTMSNIKFLNYEAESLTIVFILLSLILTFVILSALELEELSTVNAGIFSSLSVFLLLSSQLPLRESIEHAGFTFISFSCLLLSVADQEGNIINSPVYGLINLSNLERVRRVSSDDFHYLHNHHLNLTSSHSIYDAVSGLNERLDRFDNDTLFQNVNSRNAFDELELHATDMHEVNPATGLPSFEGVDVLGNSYGSDFLSNHSDVHSSTSFNNHMSACGEIDNSNILCGTDHY
ncbi:hypothetical protein [Vibrio sp. R78045]|uniref:hypothetical protein n=1 Tax=Vibrio sp. R78045 TaxID=3093868 RepID=UPI0036F366A9